MHIAQLKTFFYFFVFVGVCFPFLAHAQTESAQPEQIALLDAGLSLEPGEESILFDASKIKDLERVLRVYELREEIDLSDITPVDAQAQEDELKALPAFYYSSLIYRNANDWKAWINGKAYSAKEARKALDDSEVKDDVRVSLVSKNQIQITWDAGAYLSQVISAWKNKDNENIVLPYAHRLSATQGTPDFDLSSGTVTFTLKPNQTFIVDHFDVVEGKYTYVAETVLLDAQSAATPIVSSNFDAPEALQQEASGTMPDMGELLNQALAKQGIGSAEDGEEGNPLQEIQKEILKSIFSQ